MLLILVAFAFVAGSFTGTLVAQWIERRNAQARYDEGMARLDSLLDDERAKNLDLTALLQSQRPQDFAAWQNLLNRPDPEPSGPPMRYLYDDWGHLSGQEEDTSG